LATIMLVLTFFSARAAASITDKMAKLRTAALTHATPAPAVALTNEISGAEKFWLGVRSGWKDYFAPARFAVAIVYLGISFANRGLFTALDQAGLVWTPAATEENKPLPDIPTEGILFAFDIKTLQFPDRGTGWGDSIAISFGRRPT
jgi:hypothetical protein